MRTPEIRCISCNERLDAVTSAMPEEATPNAGDLSICFYCGHLSCFNADLTMRELTSEEMYQVAGDKEILRIQRARARANRERPT